MSGLAYRNLIVWQKADELAFNVYQITAKFPKEEIFGIVSQMRRAGLSVAANIVEGYARLGKKENLHFCYIARGSLTELEYFLDFSFKLKYLEQEDYTKVSNLRSEVGKLLQGYIRSI